MNILVTGAAGFIGARTVGALLDAGHDVVGLDNLDDGYGAALKQHRLDGLRERPRFRSIQGDVRRKEDLAAAFAHAPDAVINLAARAGIRRSLAEPLEYLDTNATGTLMLLEACRQHDVDRFVLASTSSLYGARTPVPFHEDASTERPLSPYAATKKAAEALLASYAHLYGIHAPALRFFTVYGPAGRPDMAVFRFVEAVLRDTPIQVYGDGRQRRDFTYVDDVASGVAASLSVDGFEIINLGCDRPLALGDLIAEIESIVGRPARIQNQPAHAADVHATWADVGKAKKLLGWEPTTPLEEGLRRTVEWHIQHQALAGSIPEGRMTK